MKGPECPGVTRRQMHPVEGQGFSSVPNWNLCPLCKNTLCNRWETTIIDLQRSTWQHVSTSTTLSQLKEKHFHFKTKHLLHYLKVTLKSCCEAPLSTNRPGELRHHVVKRKQQQQQPVESVSVCGALLSQSHSPVCSNYIQHYCLEHRQNFQ